MAWHGKPAQGRLGINYSRLRCESDTTTRKKKLQGRNVEPEPSHYTTVRELGYSLSASNDKQWASIWKFMNEVFVQSQRKLEIFSFSFPFSAGKVSQDGRLGGIRLRLYAHLKMAMGVDEQNLRRFRDSLESDSEERKRTSLCKDKRRNSLVYYLCTYSKKGRQDTVKGFWQNISIINFQYQTEFKTRLLTQIGQKGFYESSQKIMSTRLIQFSAS